MMAVGMKLAVGWLLEVSGLGTHQDDYGVGEIGDNAKKQDGRHRTVSNRSSKSVNLHNLNYSPILK